MQGLCQPSADGGLELEGRKARGTGSAQNKVRKGQGRAGEQSPGKKGWRAVGWREGEHSQNLTLGTKSTTRVM